MNTRLLLLAVSALAFGSCTTMYKSGQTPDDVYYSPGVEQSGYARTQDQANEEDGYVDMNDRYLRMKSSSKRWSTFDDDFAYWNNPMWNTQMAFNTWNSPWGWNSGWSVGVGFGNAWANPWMWNNPWAWNSGWGWNAGFGWGRPGFWNNPFCPTFYGNPVVIINPKPLYGNPRANGPRTYNLNTYNPRTGIPTYVDPKTGRTSYTSNSGTRGVRVFSNMTTTTNTTGGGRYMRIDGTGTGSSARPRGGYGGYDNNGTRSSNPTRTFEPRSSSGGSSGRSFGGGSGSSGGSAPTRSFGRGGGN